jgi:hypothetical protein
LSSSVHCGLYAGPTFHSWPLGTVVVQRLGNSVGYSRAAPCRFACWADEIRDARNVITADRGDESATEEGDAAVATKFDGLAVVK